MVPDDFRAVAAEIGAKAELVDALTFSDILKGRGGSSVKFDGISILPLLSLGWLMDGPCTRALSPDLPAANSLTALLLAYMYKILMIACQMFTKA